MLSEGDVCACHYVDFVCGGVGGGCVCVYTIPAATLFKLHASFDRVSNKIRDDNSAELFFWKIEVSYKSLSWKVYGEQLGQWLACSIL